MDEWHTDPRVLPSSTFDTSTEYLFQVLSWRKLESQRQIQKACMVYKSLNGLAPGYLRSRFVERSAITDYSLRNTEDKLAVPLPRTNFLKNSFRYSGALLWTGLEQSMKPMIGKSIDQSMTIDALLVNWHRLASANRWPIDNHTKVVATHRLPSIGVKKSQYPTRSSMYVYELAVRTNVWDLNLFTGLLSWVEFIICMQLHGFKNQKQKYTLKQCMYAHVLHDVSITIVKRLTFYRSFQH